MARPERSHEASRDCAVLFHPDRRWDRLGQAGSFGGSLPSLAILLDAGGAMLCRSKGMACVRYATVEEAANAVAPLTVKQFIFFYLLAARQVPEKPRTLNGSEFKGRPLKVDHWTPLGFNILTPRLSARSPVVPRGKTASA